MANENYYYITAGLQKTKDDTNDSPAANRNTYYLTAGLPKVVEAAPGGFVSQKALVIGGGIAL